MRPPSRARLVRIPLPGDVSAAACSLLVRGDAHPFALTGAWAGGGALVGSEPLVVAPPEADPFALLDLQPDVEGWGAAGEEAAGVEGVAREAAVGAEGVAGEEAAGAVGGGWFGYFGYGLGARLEIVPPGPPRPAPLPRFALGFYDHLLRLDPAGRWWFEALWSDERDTALRERLDRLAARLSGGVRERPVRVGPIQPCPPGAAGHLAAVAACRERIAAGEIFQANLCLRLEGSWSGDPVDLFARAAGALGPRHAALVAGPWGAVCSMSPELFLRRRGRQVTSEPIKGTAPRGSEAAADAARAALSGSGKDRAENVMIVDLMRNDLGRVCEYGSVSVPALTEPRPAPGVWHLVSTVTGTLRPEVDDSDLLRASFPPGSVTGAPKIRTMRVIAELEATGREAYTGAIGYASPVAGLELNVAIRTLETRGERIWLGAGGGIVADSDPQAELEECLLKARPVVEAAGGRIAEARRPPARARKRPAEAFEATAPSPAREQPAGAFEATAAGERPADPLGATAATRPSAARELRPVFALDDESARPDPERGVLSTMLVREGTPLDLGAHLGRLGDSVRELYGQELPGDLGLRVQEATAPHRLARLRLLAAPAGGGEASVGVEAHRLAAVPDPAPMRLAAATLPGGLGSHKWRDRRLLAELERRLGAVALLVDLDGEVLEAAHANVWIVEDRELLTPPLDGRLLPGTVRARLLADPPAGLTAREEPLTVERVAAADELFLTSSVRGVHPATLPGRAAARFRIAARVRAALVREGAASTRGLQESHSSPVGAGSPSE